MADEHHRQCPGDPCNCVALRMRDEFVQELKDAPPAPYFTQGKCDYCDARPGELVNHLAPCACSMGIGASATQCRCSWGRTG